MILASEERALRIQATRNEQESDTSFSVSNGSETLGALHKGNDGWGWTEGTRSPEEANIIGCEIDAHFDA